MTAVHRIYLQNPETIRPAEGQKQIRGREYGHFQEANMIGVQTVLKALTALAAVDCSQKRYYSKSAIKLIQKRIGAQHTGIWDFQSTSNRRRFCVADKEWEYKEDMFVTW